MAYYILKSFKLKNNAFSVFEALSRRKGCFFLDSSLNNIQRGRFSIIGLDPFMTISGNDESCFRKLRSLNNKYRFEIGNKEIPFTAGAVGFISYDLGFKLEKKIKTRDKPGLKIPGYFFNLYNHAVVIDHYKDKLYVFSCGLPEKNSIAQRLICRKNYNKILKLLSASENNSNKRKREDPGFCSKLHSSFKKDEYLEAIEKAKNYIIQGDIYQVNLSQQFNARINLSALELYKRLRKISPTYFSAYLDGGSFQILSSSPERFLKLSGRKAVTMPMKGTRPRSTTKCLDKKFKLDLLSSEKDKAELMMIVDLERNDLGKVCAYDSIKVERLRQLEAYSTVFQTTATISGKLFKEKDALDLLRACFPGGSITGCPKLRAMQIIEELEPHRRSIYTGCLGYLSFSQEMEFNILIRTILKIGKQIYFGVGGGIVADSDPQAEYEETLVKARAMMQAIR